MQDITAPLHPSVHPSVVCVVSPAAAAAASSSPGHSGRPVHPQLPAMALVTLQRSPTPSAASTASTATTTAGEVSLMLGEQKCFSGVGEVERMRESWKDVAGEQGPLIEAKLAALVNVLC